MNSFTIYSQNTRFVFFRKRERSFADGKITFLENRILVNDSVFSVDTLEKIHFLCFDDYTGRILNAAENKLSEGINNTVELHLKDGEKIIFQFQLTERYQIRDIRDQLIQYHLAGKLDFLNLTGILGIEEYNAIQNFKQTLASYAR